MSLADDLQQIKRVSAWETNPGDPADGPRAWTYDEKVDWAQLPRSIRKAIKRREDGRDSELRRMQNRLADLTNPKGVAAEWARRQKQQRRELDNEIKANQNRERHKPPRYGDAEYAGARR